MNRVGRKRGGSSRASLPIQTETIRKRSHSSRPAVRRTAWKETESLKSLGSTSAVQQPQLLRTKVIQKPGVPGKTQSWFWWWHHIDFGSGTRHTGSCALLTHPYCASSICFEHKHEVITIQQMVFEAHLILPFLLSGGNLVTRIRGPYVWSPSLAPSFCITWTLLPLAPPEQETKATHLWKKQGQGLFQTFCVLMF